MLDSEPLTSICRPIEAPLAALHARLLAGLDSDIPLIREVGHYVIQNGGKRLRPILTFLSAALCGANPAALVSYACAIEYIHTASLLHDDVIDKAALRRGRASANASWGNEVSVLVGDFFYCRASELLVEAGNLSVLQVISRAIVKTTEGEVLEIEKKHDIALSEADYLQIIYYKTAILMGAACESGAIVGEAAAREREGLRLFGEALGMAFQLADDVLDYASGDAKFGKENGTDLKQGHLTLPMIYALQRASEKEQAQFKESYSADGWRHGQLSWVTALMDKYGSFTQAMATAEHYIAQAKSALNVFVPSPAKESLVALAEYVASRTY